MIHSVTPKADLRVERSRGEEPPSASGPKPRADNGHSEEELTSQASIDRAKIDRAATKVTEVLILADPQLKIHVDDETERIVVKVVEQNSGEVIRQIPPEELLELEKYLSSPKGLLLQEQA